MRSWTCWGLAATSIPRTLKRTGISRHQSGGQTHERGLPRSIRSDQRGKRAAPDLEGNIIECLAWLRLYRDETSYEFCLPMMAGAISAALLLTAALAQSPPCRSLRIPIRWQIHRSGRAEMELVGRILHENPDLVDQARSQLCRSPPSSA